MSFFYVLVISIELLDDQGVVYYEHTDTYYYCFIPIDHHYIGGSVYIMNWYRKACVKLKSLQIQQVQCAMSVAQMPASVHTRVG